MGKKILIAEDEANLLFTVRSRLEFEGFAVSTAGDGEEALQKVQEEKPDLILLDVMMPKMNGYKVARLLKFDESYKRIPIIMMTGRTQPKDVEQGKHVGADEYVTKPFEIEELIELIKKYVKKE